MKSLTEHSNTKANLFRWFKLYLCFDFPLSTFPTNLSLASIKFDKTTCEIPAKIRFSLTLLITYCSIFVNSAMRS